jgi:hypothetical protein
MTTDIRRLLDNYFEGTTSVEEENTLRRYFAQDDISEDLQLFAPIFRFLEDESTALAALEEIRRERDIPVLRKHVLWRKLRTIAAVVAVLLATVLLLTRPDKQLSTVNGNYVWVDGKQITDLETVQKYAEISFGKIKPEKDIMEEQLNFVLE